MSSIIQVDVCQAVNVPGQNTEADVAGVPLESHEGRNGGGQRMRDGGPKRR